MSTRNFLIATIVASAAFVNAQSIPASCQRVSELVGSCVPADATEQDILGPTVANCICKAGDFDADLIDCVQEAGSVLPEDYAAALEAFRGYCSLYAGGGGGPTPDPDPTPTTRGGGSQPTETSGTGSEYCDYFLSGIEQCWTDSNPLPTAPPVAKCLCGGGQFDVAVEGCYSDLVNVNPDGASTVGAFGGFCSSYSAGAFDSPATETTRGGGFNQPTRSIVDDNDTPSNTRVIQSPTSRPNNNDNDEDDDNNNNNNNNNNDSPNTAGTIKVAALGTSLVAILAGAALFL